jgi:hypothetical protein
MPLDLGSWIEKSGSGDKRPGCATMDGANCNLNKQSEVLTCYCLTEELGEK